MRASVLIGSLLVLAGCATSSGSDPMPDAHSDDSGRDAAALPPDGDAGAGDDGASAAPDATPAPDASSPPDATSPPACPDTLASSPVVEGPAGIMVQTHTADLCVLERSLAHICSAHRGAGTGRISDLVLTDAVGHDSAGRPSEELNTEVLDRVLAHRHCFDNLFIGTVPEVILADPYGADIGLEASRWEWLNAARRVADAVVAYMAREAEGVSWHWYVSYEANLNFFTTASYRSNYVALLHQHVADLNARRGGTAVFWSPTFWTDPADLSASARTALRSAIADFFTRVPGITWVAVQDHVGVSPSFTCADALVYYDLVRAAAPSLASVQLNVEYFDATAGGIRDGDPTELASRLACYASAGARVGASFDFRYWYATHGH